MEDVRVPLSHQLNVTGLKGPFSCLNQARHTTSPQPTDDIASNPCYSALSIGCGIN